MRIAPLITILTATLLLPADPTLAARNSGELFRKAESRRQVAEAKLASDRKSRLEERKRLAAELRKAYENLGEARGHADRVADRLRRLEDAKFGHTMSQGC